MHNIRGGGHMKSDRSLPTVAYVSMYISLLDKSEWL